LSARKGLAQGAQDAVSRERLPAPLGWWKGFENPLGETFWGNDRVFPLWRAIIDTDKERQGLEWQVGVWNRISQLYLREVDPRFATVVQNVLTRGGLKQGHRVLDLGTGTGSVAIGAARLVGPAGRVTGVDISPHMLALARRQIAESGLSNVDLREGRAEQLPADDGSFDVVLASLSLMYVIDRAVAARELRRVLRPGGQFVAAVWAAAERCDIVLFQQTAGKFAPSPPIPGVGPGALADPSGFLAQLADAGIDARVETEELGFDFHDFDLAWEVLASVTTAQIPPERRQEAKEAVQAAMWPDGRGPRYFRNVTQFLVGRVP
jgi:enediyne biosynthesis protein CalE5